MPCEIIPDTLDLEMETLEAINPDPSQPETFRAAYPFPLLRKTGQIRSLSFRTITLVNDFVSATFAIDLGGRLIALHDKRTGVDVLPLPKTLDIKEGGRRGVHIPYGLQILAGEGARPNEMGPVEFLCVEPEDESDHAALIIQELVPGSGLSWQATWRLPANSGALEIEFRMTNRTQVTRNATSGMRGWVDPEPSFARKDGFAFGSVFVSVQPGSFDDFAPRHVMRRFDPEQKLIPGETDNWSATVFPLVGDIPLVLATSAHGSVQKMGQTFLSFELASPLAEGKLVLQLDHERSVEAQVSFIKPGDELVNISEIGGELTGVALLNSSGVLLLQWQKDPIIDLASSKHLKSAGWRGFGHWQLAVEALKQKDYEKADEHLENSLLYNGDDPLTWWLKAVVRRLIGDEGERHELLNAHFLSPLEPALRCESFLSQNEQGKDPSPLLAPLAKHPEALIDVTCMLIDVHLIEEATRLIDEALRHREQPMLRYLWAWLHLSRSSMEFEAAKHVQIAEKLPFEPPFPWRQVEKQALTELHARFPDMSGLKRWFDLADVFIEGH